MKRKYNDSERSQWVNNDEGLYRLYLSDRPRISLTLWVKRNRDFIDEVIDNVLSGKKRSHYLAYDSVSF